MNLSAFYPELVKALGWTLLHSLWQGLVLSLILWFLLVILKHKPPQFKYLLSLGFLVFFVGWMSVTFSNHFSLLDGQSLTISQNIIGAEETNLKPIAALNISKLETVSTPAWKKSLQKVEQSLGTFVDSNAHHLVKIWLLGVLVFGFRWLASVYYTYRLRNIKTNNLPHIWQMEVAQLADALGINKKIKLLESAKVDVPLIIGHLRPVILIPVGALTGLTPEQIRAILLHELAHIRRYDFLINLILSGLEVILFYHPAFWWISSVIRQEREKCCDDVAISACGNAKFYARTLLIMEEKRQQKSLAMAFQGNKNQLLHRIKRICLVPQHTQRNDFSKTGLLLGLFLAIGVWAWAKLPMSIDKPEVLMQDEVMAKDLESAYSFNWINTPEETPPTIHKESSEEQPDIAAEEAPEPIETPVSNTLLAMPFQVDTVPYPSLPALNLPTLAAFPEFPYSFEQLQAEHEKGKPYMELINPYKEDIDAWRAAYSENFLKHWQSHQKEIHQSYDQWVKKVKNTHGGDELAAAIELHQSRIFEKALKDQERAMSKSEKEVKSNVETSIREIERSLQSIEKSKEDHDARMAVHDDRMAMHDLRMSVHDIRMDMHDARMSVHDTRMAMHDDRMAAHDIIMKAFKKELFDELTKDGLIKSKNDDFELMVNNSQVEINGKTLTDAQSEKYIKLIKSYGFRIEEGKSWGIIMNKNNTSIGTFGKRQE